MQLRSNKVAGIVVLPIGIAFIVALGILIVRSNKQTLANVSSYEGESMGEVIDYIEHRSNPGETDMRTAYSVKYRYEAKDKDGNVKTYESVSSLSQHNRPEIGSIEDILYNLDNPSKMCSVYQYSYLYTDINSTPQKVVYMIAMFVGGAVILIVWGKISSKKLEEQDEMRRMQRSKKKAKIK